MDDQPGIDRLLRIVEKLRSKDGCPWDREQTIESLKSYLIEECYEVIDAVDSGDPAKHAEELGDVLLQIVLHSQIRKEKGEFTFDDVANRLADKLVRRHPHVFGDKQVADSREVLQNWEILKSQEKAGGKRSVVEGVPRHLPALQKAQRIQSRASRVGFDWSEVHDVIGKVDEELAETRQAIAEGDTARIKEEIGDLLFAVVNLSRFQRVSSEEALEATINKFVRRFRAVEERVHAEGRDLTSCTLEELDAHWNAVKQGE